jgi:hypothetical protein
MIQRAHSASQSDSNATNAFANAYRETEFAGKIRQATEF